MNLKIKKNLLDLHFQKYLTFLSLSVVISFTYLIAVVIAVLTAQIKLDSFFSMSILFIFSTAVLGLCSFLFFKSLFHLKNIINSLKELS
ncbi:hypothetical protein J4402_01255 [Candidatus Pacearchaeota archaeon]|nr:hypothetical protein [Candidatus Pacearchaeota archaeon]